MKDIGNPPIIRRGTPKVFHYDFRLFADFDTGLRPTPKGSCDHWKHNRADVPRKA